MRPHQNSLYDLFMWYQKGKHLMSYQNSCDVQRTRLIVDNFCFLLPILPFGPKFSVRDWLAVISGNRKPGFLMPDRLLLSLLQDGPCFINNMNAYVFEFWYPMWQKKIWPQIAQVATHPFFPLLSTLGLMKKKSPDIFFGILYTIHFCAHTIMIICVDEILF